MITALIVVAAHLAILVALIIVDPAGFRSTPTTPEPVIPRRAPEATHGPWATHGSRCTCNVCR